MDGKGRRSPIPVNRTFERSVVLLDLVHSDVCGPMEVSSFGGSRYFVSFIDDHSNLVCVDEQIAKNLNEKFSVMFDGLSHGYNNFFGIFASFPDQSYRCHYESLLEFTPLEDEIDFGSIQNTEKTVLSLQIWKRCSNSVVSIG